MAFIITLLLTTDLTIEDIVLGMEFYSFLLCHKEEIELIKNNNDIPIVKAMKLTSKLGEWSEKLEAK